MTTTHNLSDANDANQMEELVSDLGGLLANKEFDAVPEIKAIRKRIDQNVQNVRKSTVMAAREAARQAREAAVAANDYAHDEPWRVAGVALAVGAVLGFLMARR